MLTKNRYLANATLGLLRGTAIHSPATIYLCLTATSPLRTDTNATLPRPGYAGYADTLISTSIWSSITEDPATGSSQNNSSPILFPSPTVAPSSPISIAGVFILDDAQNVLYQAPLASPVTVTAAGQIIQIPANALVLSEL